MKTWITSEYVKEIKSLYLDLHHTHGAKRKTIVRQLHTAQDELRKIQRDKMCITDWQYV